MLAAYLENSRFDVNVVSSELYRGRRFVHGYVERAHDVAAASGDNYFRAAFAAVKRFERAALERHGA